MDDTTPINPYLINNQSQPPSDQQVHGSDDINSTPFTDQNTNGDTFSQFNGTTASDGFYSSVAVHCGESNSSAIIPPLNSNGDLTAVKVKTEVPSDTQSAELTAESMQTAETIHTVMKKDEGNDGLDFLENGDITERIDEGEHEGLEEGEHQGPGEGERQELGEGEDHSDGDLEEDESCSEDELNPLDDVTDDINPQSTTPGGSNSNIIGNNIALKQEMNGDADNEIAADGSLVYCRLCAQLTDSAVNIFDSEETVDKALNMNLYEKLVTYFPIIISKEDLLPKTVCTVCIAKVELTLQFNKQIVTSHKFFLDKFNVSRSLPAENGDTTEASADNNRILNEDSKMSNKAMPANMGKLSAPSLCDLPSYLRKLATKGGSSGKRKKKKYVLMEVEDETGAKKQAYKIKKRFIPALTTCTICGLTSDTVLANNKHWSKEHPNQIIEYKCFGSSGQCEFTTSSIMNMKLHTKEHMFKEGLMEQCDLCNKYFAKRQMKAHLAVHSELQQFSCKECGKMFKFKSGLQTHEKTHDPSYTQNLFTCPECGKQYSMKHQYDAHVRRHTEVRPYRCEICLKAFWSPHDLQYHETIHTGLRPFKCDLCDQSFARDLDRKKHFMVKHTEPNKYSCSLCPVKYNRKDQLLVHELNHRGETPFKCELCSKGFTRKDKLTRHMDVHVTDDSKYRFSCHLCGKRYTQSGSLFTHMKNSHNGAQ